MIDKVCVVCGRKARRWLVGVGVEDWPSIDLIALASEYTPTDDHLDRLGFCEVHSVVVRAGLLLGGLVPEATVGWDPGRDPATLPPYLRRRERQALTAVRDAWAASWEAERPERERQAEALYQRERARTEHLFRRARRKRKRLEAAHQLATLCLRRDPNLAADACEYIQATSPPDDPGEAFDLATTLETLNRLEAAERGYRSALAAERSDPSRRTKIVERLSALLRRTGREDEADALERSARRDSHLADLLHGAVIRAGQYAAGGRGLALAPSVAELLDPDESPEKVLWAMDLPVPRGAGFAIRTDRRVLVVQDHLYLESGVPRHRVPLSETFALDSAIARRLDESP